MAEGVRAGVGWSTHFNRSGWRRLLYRRLIYAYRAPSFFAEHMLLAKGNELKFLRFDEALKVTDLDGTKDALAESVDILYVASHGEYESSTYRLDLHEHHWEPCSRGFAYRGPSVAVFDTCDLLDFNDPDWPVAWKASAGPSLRLLLGFASPATVAGDSTRRGAAFAQKILAGMPIGPAWLEAVHGTAYAGLDVGVAVGFGDNDTDAERSLNQLTLTDLPSPRRQLGVASMKVQACP